MLYVVVYLGASILIGAAILGVVIGIIMLLGWVLASHSVIGVVIFGLLGCSYVGASFLASWLK